MGRLRSKNFVAVLLIMAIVGAGMYYLGSEVERRAQIHQTDCVLGTEYSEALGEAARRFLDAYLTDMVSQPGLVVLNFTRGMGAFNRTRTIAMSASLAIGSPSWRALASLDPTGGWVALRGNLLASRSVGRWNASAGNTSWEWVFVGRSNLITGAVYSALGQGAADCPSSIDLGKFPMSTVSYYLKGDLQTEINNFNTLANNYLGLSHT